MQRFQKFLQGEWSELLEVQQQEGRRSLPQLESPAGKASKIIGALAGGNLTKAMAQLTPFGVAPVTDATVNTITGMLRPNDDRLPQGLDYLAKELGRILSLREVTHHLRMMGRGKAKDVAGWAPEHLCVVLGHPDLGKELTNFFNHSIQDNLGSTHAADGHTLEQGNQMKATTPGLRGDVSQSCQRRSRSCRSSEPRKGIRTDTVRSRTEGSAGITLERHPGGDQNKMQRCCGTIRLQLGIKPRGPYDDSVSHSPPVSAPCTLFLQHPFAHHRSIWFARKTVAQCWSPRMMV